MFKELINSLSFMYCFAARSRGKLQREELDALRKGANVMNTQAPAVLSQDGRMPTDEERRDLEEAEMIDSHIEEMVAWLLTVDNF